jgi:hypothetical protein
VRYIDTGSRNPEATLGTWLDDALQGGTVKELRIQVGYVGPQPFGYLEGVLRSLSASDGITEILIGSNNGETSSVTVEDLLRIAGPPRPNLHIGVVSFSDGLFHPKVYHATYNDGRMAAYVGSANFTYAGASGKNVESGVILDSNEGDARPLVDVLAAIDAWFREDRDGLYLVRTVADLLPLIADGVLDTPRAGATRKRPTVSTRTSRALVALAGLIRLPAISTPVQGTTSARAIVSNATQTSLTPVAPPFVDSWSKELSVSDAQRKPDGNQSGVVVLTQANRRGHIDQTTYFRNDLFGQATWQQAPTRTGHMMDTAQIPMHTTVLGNYLGVLTFDVTHDHLREAQQSNYTAKLSLRPIRLQFEQINMSGRTLEIGRDAQGRFWLDIG